MSSPLSDSPQGVDPASPPEGARASLRVRLMNLGAVVIPFAGLVAAIVLLWGVAFNWIYLALMVGMYLGTVFGVTIGFHRLFTHRSFRAPRPVAFVLGVLGSMAVEGSILDWAATHRKHHHESDSAADPHSPHGHGESITGFLRGLWHSHTGWLFTAHKTDARRYVPDLEQDPLVRWTSRLFPVWVAAGLLIPTGVAWAVTGTWVGAVLGLLWGGLVRVFLVHHVTWSVNSVCHLWGTKPFRSHDESRNNAILGVLALGEGWHNNHHAFPTSARHGLAWWQLDLSYLVIRAMGLVGLARDIRVPNEARIQAKRADRRPRPAAGEDD